MLIKSETNGDRAILKLGGRFDFHSHRDFRASYEKLLEGGGAREIVLDFAEVDYLDSSALGMLLLLREKAEGAGKAVVLSGLQGTVKQVLDIANFGKLFTIKP
jgi:anti-anti-sigma factor